MTAIPHTITFDCSDAFTLVQFWSRLTGYREDPDNPNAPDDPEALLVSPAGGPNLLFINGPDRKTIKNRVHLDMQPTDLTRDEQVAAALALGATQVADHREADGRGWVVLADPEGNEFCIERSAAERAAPTAPPAPA